MDFKSIYCVNKEYGNSKVKWKEDLFRIKLIKYLEWETPLRTK